MVSARLLQRRLGVGNAGGSRGPVGPARAAVDLVNLTKPGVGDDAPELITPLGYKTARVRMASLINDLGADDPRYMAAVRYAHCVERVGAVAISDPMAAR